VTTLVVVLSTFLAAAGPRAALVCPSGTKHQQLRYGNGSIEEWCVDERGLRHGPQESRYPNGVLVAHGSYDSGTQDGTWRYFFNNGVKWREDQWEFGQQKSSWVNPVVYTLSRDELTALGAGSDSREAPPSKKPRK
jgi:hypothetical protein